MFSARRLRNTTLFSLLFIFVFTSAFSFLIPSVKAAPPYTEPQLDVQRTILYNMQLCLSWRGDRGVSAIDTRRGYFGGAGGLDSIGNFIYADLVVVGVNVDDKDGVWSCLDVLTAGINILVDRGVIPASDIDPESGIEKFTWGKFDSGSSEQEQAQSLNRWFTKYVKDQLYKSLTGQFPVSQQDFESKLDEIKALAKTEFDSIQITDALKQTRYILLFNACYDSWPAFNGQPNYGAGDFTYQIPSELDLPHFYMKKREDAAFRAELDRWVTVPGEAIGGDDRDIRLGDIDLGFSRLGESSTYSEVNPFSGDDFDIYDGGGASNWYPLGTDIEPDYPSQPPAVGRGIADCGLFADNQVVREIMLSTGVEVDPVEKKLVFKDGVNPEFDAGQSGTNDITLADAEPTCEGADALGWIFCPVVTGLYSFSEFIFEKTIVPFLKVEPINTNSGVIYAIWASFRTIGNIILIFGLLFIVFGQAIGGGLVDAYTAKKAMPRIFVAAILINLSIYIVALMIDVANVFGQGVGGLFLSPANSAGASIQVDGVIGLLGTILAIGIPLLLIVAVRGRKDPEMQTILVYCAVFFGIPIVILVLGIFATLIIRLGLILILTAVSPVALALFVTPASDKWAKKWFDLFIKTLLVYPIMMAIFAVATLLSIVMSQTVGGINWTDIGVALAAAGVVGVMGKSAGLGAAAGIVGLIIADGKDILVSLLSIVVLFAPMAMIPFAFKLAGGIMGSAIGLATKARSKVSHKMEMAKHRPGVYNPHSQEMEYDALAGIQHKAAHRFKVSRGGNITNFVAGTPKGTSTAESLRMLNPFASKKTRARLRQNAEAARTDRRDQAGTAGAKGARSSGRRAGSFVRPDSGAIDPRGVHAQMVDPDNDPPTWRGGGSNPPPPPPPPGGGGQPPNPFNNGSGGTPTTPPDDDDNNPPPPPGGGGQPPNPFNNGSGGTTSPSLPNESNRRTSAIPRYIPPTGKTTTVIPRNTNKPPTP